jgi:hypothetical protein
MSALLTPGALAVVIPASGDAVDFDGSWRQAWGAVTGAAGISGVMTLLGIAGMGIALIALISWLFERRRSGQMGGPGTNKLLWAVLVGAVIAAPNMLIPLVLWLMDALVNGVGKVLGLVA